MSDINVRINVISGAAEKSVTGLAKAAKDSEKSFNALNLSVKNTASTFKIFAGNLGADAVRAAVRGISNGISSLIRTSFDSTKALEDLGVQFQVLTGSAGVANDLIQELTDFTARTPFRLQGVGNAARQLIAFGFEADTVTDRLQDIGDVAAASGADLKEVSLIYGQVAAAGKLTGERLLQLQERAIPIGPALAETLGVAESAVRDLVSEGKVSFTDFENAFNSLNEEGQFAFGGIDKASRTLSGRISTLQDNFQLFAAQIGKLVLPAVKAIVETTTQLVQSFSNSTKSLLTTADASNILINVFNGVVEVGRFVAQTILGIRAAANVLSAVLSGVVGTIVTVVEGLVKLAAVASSLAGIEFKGLNEAAQGLENLRKASFATADSLLDDADDIATSIVTVENVSDSFISKLEANTAKQIQLSDAATNNKVSNDKKQVQSETTKQQQLDAFALAEAERLRVLDEETQAFIQFTGERDFEQLVESLGAQEAARIAAQATRLQNEGKAAEASKAINNGLVKAAEQRRKAEDEIQKKQLDDKRSFFSSAISLSNSNNKTLAAIGKAAALTQIAINTPPTVSSAYRFGALTGGPALGAVFGGIAAAAQAAQAAKVAGLAFQDGGIVPGSSFSGDNVVARVNSGEMILNRQQQAQLFAQANGSAAGGQEIVVNTSIELDGETIGRAVSRQVANGLELGEVV